MDKLLEFEARFLRFPPPSLKICVIQQNLLLSSFQVRGEQDPIQGDPILFSHMSDRNTTIWTSPAAFQVHVSRKLEPGMEPGFEHGTGMLLWVVVIPSSILIAASNCIKHICFWPSLIFSILTDQQTQYQRSSHTLVLTPPWVHTYNACHIENAWWSYFLITNKSIKERSFTQPSRWLSWGDFCIPKKIIPKEKIRVKSAIRFSMGGSLCLNMSSKKICVGNLIPKTTVLRSRIWGKTTETQRTAPSQADDDCGCGSEFLTHRVHVCLSHTCLSGRHLLCYHAAMRPSVNASLTIWNSLARSSWVSKLPFIRNSMVSLFRFISFLQTFVLCIGKSVLQSRDVHTDPSICCLTAQRIGMARTAPSWS